MALTSQNGLAELKGWGTNEEVCIIEGLEEGGEGGGAWSDTLQDMVCVSGNKRNLVYSSWPKIRE